MINKHLLEPGLGNSWVPIAENNISWLWENVLSDEKEFLMMIRITVDENGKMSPDLSQPSGPPEKSYCPLSCLRDSLRFPSSRVPLQRLMNGQKHDQNAYQSLDEAYFALGHHNFWRLVASAVATDRTSDWKTVTDNLEFSRTQSSATVMNAKKSIEIEDEVQAMYFLLLGQSHNSGAMLSYRWAAKTDLPHFFDTVMKLR